MDFSDTPSEAAFRAEARAWLAENAPKHALPAGTEIGEGYSHMPQSRAWQAAKAAGGFAQITWPKEYGGRGGTPIEQVIFDEEQRHFDVPPNAFGISLPMCVTTLMQWGSEEAKARLIPPALRGETLWAQLFSEPSAGSDLANVRTRAVRDGDDWLITGQKVWTTGAHVADWGTILVRTDPTAEKYAGLSYFYFDMHSPGVEVRPIRQPGGGSGFNEVWLNEVRVPASQMLGAEGHGWKVAISTLMNERMSVNEADFGTVTIDDVVALARDLTIDGVRAIDDPVIRARLAQIYARIVGVRYTRYRHLTTLSKGGLPGPEAAMGKAVLSLAIQEMTRLAMDMHGQAGIVNDRQVDARLAAMHEAYFGAAGYRIAGGTDEILKNTIAERVLGLPGEIRVDRGIPFNQLQG